MLLDEARFRVVAKLARVNNKQLERACAPAPLGAVPRVAGTCVVERTWLEVAIREAKHPGVQLPIRHKDDRLRLAAQGVPVGELNTTEEHTIKARPERGLELEVLYTRTIPV